MTTKVHHHEDRLEEDCLKEYLGQIANHRLLSREEEIELFQRHENGDLTARDQIVRCNLRLVVKIALQFRHSSVPVADLIQEGNIGLLHVVEKFDWRLGFRFSTYAAFWIRQEIQTAIRNGGAMIRLPVRKARLLGKINDAIRHVAATEGREPGIDQIAALLGEDPARIAVMMPMREPVISLDADPQGEGNALLATMAHDGPAPDARLKTTELRQSVRGVLEHLTEREREVIELRYGLKNGACLSLRKTSTKVGLSQEGVRRVEMRALEKLRRPAEIARLGDLLTA